MERILEHQLVLQRGAVPVFWPDSHSQHWINQRWVGKLCKLSRLLLDHRAEWGLVCDFDVQLLLD